MQIIDQAASATKSLPLPLPPKDKQQAPLAVETAAVADDVNDEASGTSTSHDIAPHETTTDGSRHDASGDTDAGTNTDNNENTEKKVATIRHTYMYTCLCMCTYIYETCIEIRK